MTLQTPTDDLQFDRSGRTLTVYVTGELDAELAPTVADQIRTTLRGTDQELWLDLSEVTFCDSCAMRLIFSLHRQLTESGGRFVVYDPAPAVRRVISMVDPRARLKVRPGSRWPVDPSADRTLSL